MSLRESFRLSPKWYYAFSIAATWANAGSLLNGCSIVQKNGLLPFLLWAIGNTAACAVFGLLAPRVPGLREVFRSRGMKILMGLMCPFQCWIAMNGIQTVFADTALGDRGGALVALGIGAFFLVLLLKNGMIRNVLTDHVGWVAVYALVFALSLTALARYGFTSPALGADGIAGGIKNAILLIPGAFLYPYYWEILAYNDSNEDGTESADMRSVFVLGGIAFGFYLVFIFLMGCASLSPAMLVLRAVLVTLIASSSLSSFLYSAYLTFGRRLGTGINILTLALWQLLIPLGVMGAWTLMAGIRIYIVGAAFAAAFVIKGCRGGAEA